MLLSRSLLQKITLFLCLIATGITGFSQEETHEDYYSFDANWKIVPLAKARYFIGVRKIRGSAWEWDTYNFKGPLIKVKTFSTPEGSVRNGPAYYYAETGDLDSIASFKNGKKQG